MARDGTKSDVTTERRSHLIYLTLQSLPLALFLLLSLPILPTGPVVGSRQDEWYNVVRALRALYEWGNPGYFIHPSLFYELLAGLFACHCGLLKLGGSLGDGQTYLDHFLAHTTVLLNLARGTALGFGAASLLASMHLARKLAGKRAGLLAGFVLAGSPLLADLSTSIRVDTTFLFFFILAVILTLRYRREPTLFNLVAAAVVIGVATAANYPGALLLVLFVLLKPRIDGRIPLQHVLTSAATACSVSFVVFLVLDPHVLLDFGRFWWWFTFQVRTTVEVHPHAGQPSLTYYLGVIAEQGIHVAVLACLGVFAAFRSRSAIGTLAGFATCYIVVFSMLRSQYDRFILPALALLLICGVAFAIRSADAWLGRAKSHLAFGTLFGVLLLAAIPGFARDRIHHPWQRRASVVTEPDQRQQMLDWLMENLPAHSTLIYESDTLPLLQIAYDPPEAEGRFQQALRDAFDRRQPVSGRAFVKAQFIGGVVNYDQRLLEGPQVYFLGSSRNQAHIRANAESLAGPMEFYRAMEQCSSVAHEVAARDDTLTMWVIDSRCGTQGG